MEKNVNLNSATDNAAQAKETDVKNSVTNGLRDAVPGGSSPAAVRQQGFYSNGDKPAPDNNPFFTARSNALSSKGN